MQAIMTIYHGPTDTKGARIVARCDAGRATVVYAHALDAPANHEAAARNLAGKLGWSGRMVSGALPTGAYAHVFVPEGR
jgi:hypothetical protein